MNRSSRKKTIDLTEPDVIDLTEPETVDLTTPTYVLPRKRYVKTFSKRRRPNIEALKAQNVFLRPFDPDGTRETFVRLCRKHIMVDHLDSVNSTTHMTNGRTTVFMIGETHRPHTKCKAILEMFQELVAENKAMPKPLIIDLVIELFEFEIEGVRRLVYDPVRSVQMNLIRKFFVSCVQDRNCAVRVHWADPTRTPKHLPKWLQALNALNSMTDLWTTNPLITDVLQEEADLPLILTENKAVVKEIQKASEVNPTFTLPFAVRVFEDLWDKILAESSGPWEYQVWYLKRAVMDFYTAARIVKLNMKHVIFYGGNNHVKRLRFILEALDFRVVAAEEKGWPCA
jgi:hypothetical protein